MYLQNIFPWFSLHLKFNILKNHQQFTSTSINHLTHMARWFLGCPHLTTQGTADPRQCPSLVANDASLPTPSVHPKEGTWDAQWAKSPGAGGVGKAASTSLDLQNMPKRVFMGDIFEFFYDQFFRHVKIYLSTVSIYMPAGLSIYVHLLTTAAAF